MAREPKDSDFIIGDIPGIDGNFRFGRRTYGDRLRIRAEFVRLTRDLSGADPELAALAAVVAAHKVLCVDAPDGWEDLEAIDMISDPDAEDKIFAIYSALKEKEDSFRRSANKGVEATGA